MTSEAALGAADADGRWIGVRRHQAVLVLAGVGLGFDALVRAGASPAEAVGAAVALAAAVPGPEGLTLGAWAAVAVAFATRARVARVELSPAADAVAVVERARASVRAYRLDFRGRLDLAGRDVDLARGVAGFLDALAVAGGGAHASLHVRADAAGALTVLALTTAAPPPAPWVRDDEAVESIVDVGGARAATLERWAYVRVPVGVRSVLRVRDFTGAARGPSALERVLLGSDRVAVAVHADVLDAARGRRLAERAVHRVRSDGETATAAGFRRTARASRAVERARGREVEVADGRALVRLAVFVTVRAESRGELSEERSRVERLLVESGLVADAGLGRQRRWFAAQLPGGPGW